MKRKASTKNTKRIVSVILALFLILTLFAGTTFATDDPESPEIVCTHDCADGTCDLLATGVCDHECDEDCGGLALIEPDDPETGCTHDCTDGTCDFLTTGICDHECDLFCGGLELAAPGGATGPEGWNPGGPFGTFESPFGIGGPIGIAATAGIMATASGVDIKDYFAQEGITPATIVTDASINGSPPAPPPTITVNDPVNFNFNLKIPEEIRQLIQPGDYYDITLPSDFNIISPLSNIPLMDADGVTYATFSVGTDGIVHIVFTDQIQTERNITGNINFAGQIKAGISTGPGDWDVNFPSEDEIDDITVIVKPAAGSSIDKRGAFDKVPDPSQIVWTATVNKNMDDITGLTISDDFAAAGCTFPTAMPVSPNPLVRVVMLDLYGNPQLDSNGDIIYLEPPLSSPAEYTVNAAGTVTLTGDYATTKQAIEVSWTTDITDADSLQGNVVFANTVEATGTLPDSTVVNLEAGASISAEFTPPVNKQVTGYDPSNQIISWTVHYNGGSHITDQLTLTDTLDPVTGANWQFVGPPKVYMVNPDGSRTLLNENAQYTLDLTNDPPPATLIVVLNPTFASQGDGNYDSINYPIDIEYQIEPRDGVIIDSNGSVNNTFESSGDSGTSSGNGNGGFGQQGVRKSHGVWNSTTQLVPYTLRINGNNYWMNDLTVTDTITPFIDNPPGSATLYGYIVYDGSSPLFSPNDAPAPAVFDNTTGLLLTESEDGGATGDYLLVVNNNTNFATAATPQTITIEFINGYASTNDSFTITYNYWYNVQQYPGELGPGIRNNVSINWIDDTDGPHNSNDSNTFMPTNAQSSGGLKKGSYNAVDKTITWTVAINYMGSGFNGSQLYDVIQAGQTYVPGSLQIWYYLPNAGGTDIILQRQLTDAEISTLIPHITDPTPPINEFIFDIAGVPPGGDSIIGRYAFIFQTSLDGTVIQGDGSGYYHNTGNFIDRTSGVASSWPAEVSVANAGEVGFKQGALGPDGYYWWDVWINRSQSTLSNVVVTDVPSTNQLVDLSSISIVGTNVAPDGTLTPNNADRLVEGIDYTVSYVPNADPNLTVGTPPGTPVPLGTMVLSINFLHQIDRAYLLRFRVIISSNEPVGEDVYVGNSITVSGDGTIHIEGGSSSGDNVEISSGGGWMRGDRIGFQVHKIDGNDDDLIGAIFQLYDLPLFRPIGTPFTTDSNGIIIYNNLTSGYQYVLVEEAPPPGYSLLPEFAFGIFIDLDISDPMYPAPPLYLVSTSPIYTYGIDIENMETEVSLIKENEGGDLLAGAVFRIDKLTNNNWNYFSGPYVTDANGEIHVTGIFTEGHYRFVEIEAPPGYAINRNPIEFDFIPILGTQGYFRPVTIGPYINSLAPPSSSGNTGDYSNLYIWQLALLASALGLLCIMMWRWREKRDYRKQ